MTTWLNTSFEMRFRVIDGLTIRYAQSADHSDHALLLSPWPESLLAFMPVWEPLAEYAHLVAIDLPGFGHSQRCDALASPKAMGEFIIRACDAFRLEHAHVIGPDIGTAPALFAAAQYPDRLRSLAVGGGAAAVPLQLGGLLKNWVETSDPEFFRRADPRQLVASALADIEAVRPAGPSPGGLLLLLPRQPVRRVDALHAQLSGLSPRPGRPAIEDPDAGADHRRRARHDGATGQRRIPSSAAAPQQARHHRRGPLHLGRRCSRVLGPDHKLVAWRLRRHWTALRQSD